MESPKINWVAVYNRLFRLIDGKESQENGMYYSGPRFIEKVQEHGYDCPNYGDLMRGREEHGVSTSRRDYFKDLFMFMKDQQKRSLVLEILRDCQKLKPNQCDEIRPCTLFDSVLEKHLSATFEHGPKPVTFCDCRR
jgi:hypothetical protein